MSGSNPCNKGVQQVGLSVYGALAAHQWADDDALLMFGCVAEMSEQGHEEKKRHLGFGKCTWGLASPTPFVVSWG